MSSASALAGRSAMLIMSGSGSCADLPRLPGTRPWPAELDGRSSECWLPGLDEPSYANLGVIADPVGPCLVQPNAEDIGCNRRRGPKEQYLSRFSRVWVTREIEPDPLLDARPMEATQLAAQDGERDHELPHHFHNDEHPPDWSCSDFWCRGATARIGVRLREGSTAAGGAALARPETSSARLARPDDDDDESRRDVGCGLNTPSTAWRSTGPARRDPLPSR
jgi:hypothetical protein